MLYVTQGRLDDALNILLRARTTHSLWPTVPANEILVHFFRREFESAVACGKRALELHPYFIWAISFMAKRWNIAARTP